MLRRYKRVFRQHTSIFLMGAGLFCLVFFSGYILYKRSASIMEEQLKAGLRTSASLGADHFIGGEIRLIQGPTDMGTPLFIDMVKRLNAIRDDVPNAQYVYIMRRTTDRNTLEFVVDADSLQTTEEMDVNANGIIEPDEEGSYPGDLYDVTDIPALRDTAFIEPTTDDNITVDQWGALISGYAPIRTVKGEVVAILGIDMSADDYVAVSHSVLSRLAFLVILLLGIVTVGSVMFFSWTNRMEVLNKVDAERSATMRLAYHQLGAPIAMFRWWLEILQEDTKANPEEAYGQLQEATNRMEKILKAMREATDAEKGLKKYAVENIDLSSIVQSVVADVEPRLQRKNQHIELHIEDIPMMQLDTKLITGVFHELIDNAIDYTSDSSTIVVGVEQDKRKVLVSIADTGCGIPKDETDTVFKKWIRGSNAPKVKPIGNGLGLFIAREIVERAGGEMWVESELGKGSTFWFTLPIEA